MKNIIATEYPLDEPQKDQLRTLFASPAYLLLREVIVSHCTRHQMDFANKSMYGNETAKEQAEISRQLAARFMGGLDVLDDLQKIEDQWFRISLETRR